MHGHFFCIAERGGKLDGPTPPVRWAWWFIGWEVGSDSTQLRVGACPSMASTVSGAARTGWGERGVPRHSTPSAAPQHAHGHLHPMPTWTPAPRADTDSCTPCRYGHLRHHIHTPPPPPFPAGTEASANTSHTCIYAAPLRARRPGPRAERDAADGEHDALHQRRHHRVAAAPVAVHLRGSDRGWVVLGVWTLDLVADTIATEHWRDEPPCAVRRRLL